MAGHHPFPSPDVAAEVEPRLGTRRLEAASHMAAKDGIKAAPVLLIGPNSTRQQAGALIDLH
jgi:hypothetical protein